MQEEIEDGMVKILFAQREADEWWAARVKRVVESTTVCGTVRSICGGGNAVSVCVMPADGAFEHMFLEHIAMFLELGDVFRMVDFIPYAASPVAVVILWIHRVQSLRLHRSEG